MTSSQLPLALTPRHYNRQLFADRYLEHTLPARDAWQALADEAAPVLAQVRSLLARFVASANEAQTERDLVRPVLELLGHRFEVQASLRTPKGVRKPDYLLYADQAALNANKGRVLERADLRGALAVGDAKYWERRLDVSSASETDDISRVPTDQIAFYMRHSGVPWGILTNGRRWRLYHHTSVERQDRFYEVDLKDLAELNDPTAFLYFYAFFRRAAFEPALPGLRAAAQAEEHPIVAGDAQRPGPARDPALTLDAMLRESVDYARGVSDSLKAQVFDALRHLAQGLLDYPRNRLAPDAETLRAIYAGSLIVLYRLLFILYAEARELLPLRTSQLYREEYSLYAIVREAAERLDKGLHLLTDTGRTWGRLHELFGIIDGGRPSLQVDTFNGGLFDPARHPLLDRATVGDAQLQRALEKLARVGREFIDYRDLAERHLGTIYEGLLEYHLQPIERSTDGFTIEIVNDRGERHRTGSYYTPDFVVQYIVEQTLRPALDAAVAGVRGEPARIAAVLGVNVLDPAMGSGHFPVAAMEYIARYLVELNVSPPPEIGEESDLAYWKRRVAQSCIYGVDLNPLAVDLAKLSLWLATAAKGRPLSFLDHHLRCGNALVGATNDQRPATKDRRPKTADRRRTATSQESAAQQLSMLDDAAFAGALATAVDQIWLIEGVAGSTVAQVKEQEQLYELVRRDLTERYALLADLRSARAFGEPIDAALERELLAYAPKRAASGVTIPGYERTLERVAAQGAAQRFFHWDLEFPEIFYDRHGRPLGARGGFDAIIGNPPYVRQEQLGPLKRFLQSAFPATYDGAADLFVYFYEQGVRLLRQGGRMSYIVTNKWLRAGYGAGLRGFFAAGGGIEQIIDFGHAPIFADADVFPCIIVVEKPALNPQPLLPRRGAGEPERTAHATDLSAAGAGEPEGTAHATDLSAAGAGESEGTAHATDLPAMGAGEPELTTRVTLFPREALGVSTIEDYVRDHGFSVPRSRFGAAPWSLERGDVDDLLAKIRRAGAPLAEFAGVKPYRGVLTGLNEAFLIDTATKERLIREDGRSAAIIKPYLRGQDIKRWSPEWDGLWMILLKSSENQRWPWSDLGEAAEATFAEIFPALYSWMKPLETKLRARQDKGRFWWELRSCAYYAVFEQPKLIHTDITWRAQFAFEPKPMYLLNTAYIWPIVDPYVLAVLNSPLIWSYMWRTATHGKDEALRLIYDYVVTIPIAAPTDGQREEAEGAVGRLVAITQADQAARRDTLDWLRSEFGIEKAGQKLENFAALDEAGFIVEVRGRRPKAAGGLGPAALRALRDGYREQAAPVQGRRAEALRLERRLAALVNDAYGLTAEDVELLWRSAPPRMPPGQ